MVKMCIRCPRANDLHSGVHDPNRTNTSWRFTMVAVIVPFSWSSASVQAYPSSVPCRRIWLSFLSMNTIGVVRLGPTIIFCAKSMRRKLGAPISAGRPFVHASPEAQSMASTGAQINSFEPSKSLAKAVPAVSHASTAIRCRKRRIGSPLLDRVAAAFHAGAVGAVIGLYKILLLGLRVLILRRLALAGPSTTGHGANHCPGRGTLACVSRYRPDGGSTRGPPCGPLHALATASRRASLLRGRGGG